MRETVGALFTYLNVDPPAVGRVDAGVSIGGGVVADILVPAGRAPFPTLVYFHGGGWSVCSRATHDTLARQLCLGAGAVVVNVEYRLAPEHRFPAGLEDCLTAARWAPQS
jgi:acetyl esterase